MAVEPAATILEAKFNEADASRTLGGTRVLEELSEAARRCMNGTSAARDAVAFAFSVILSLHAEDQDERMVHVSEARQLAEACRPVFIEAISFLKNGGTSEQAVQIIAKLARRTPDHIPLP